MRVKSYIQFSRTASRNAVSRPVFWLRGGDAAEGSSNECRLNVSGLRPAPEEFRKHNSAKEAGMVRFINGIRAEPPKSRGGS